MRPRPGALLGEETISARLLGHPGLLVGGPRAILLQVAHPEVAAGVAQHSEFTADPFGRLVRTLSAMDRIAFGSPDRAARTLRSLESRHRRVAGTTPGGDHYSALDPALMLWVHATLIDTSLVVDRRYLGLLDEADRHRFYAESRRLAAAFRIPETLVPPDLGSFREYMRNAAAVLEVGPDARAIARQVVRPPLGASLGRRGAVLGMLAGPLLEAVTADLLPGRLRRAYGLHRSPGLFPGGALPGPAGALADRAAATGFGVATALSRTLTPRLPALSR